MTNGRARSVLAGLLIGLLIVTGRAASVTRTAAQDGDQCVALAERAIAEAGIYCGGLLPGEVCYGHGDISARPLGASELTAVTAGDRTTLDALDVLATAAADPAGGGWGVAMLGLPAVEGATITGVLFGDAQIARPVVAGAERPTLPVFNRGSAEINLRSGAGITYGVVGQLAPGEEALADGRNEQGDWLRVQFAGGIAWAFTPLIGWEGDQSAINALTVLLPNDVTPVKLTGALFESFTLMSGDAPCAAAPSGLLLQFVGEEPAEITVNQVTLAFADATLLVTAAPGDALTVRVLADEGMVTARGVPVEVAAGGGARVNLGGGDGLTPVAAPVAMRAYPFADVAYAPLDLLAEPVACLVGAPAPDAQVSLRVGPGTQRGALGSLSTAATYTATGWANDPDGAPWWLLDTGAQPSWAAQAEVRAIGACQAVVQVEPPPLVFAPPPVPAGSDAAPAGGADLAPTANSVWQMRPGSDNMTGECSGAPAINFCDHLAAIAPASGGLSWKGMEANPYFLSRIQPNVYAYTGPNVLGTGRVSMTLSFTSATTLTMTMSLVLTSEPNCQHVYYYTGTRNW
ncbi:MAG: hypothetical protein AB1435_08295 [Chloroflexota bacterium]